MTRSSDLSDSPSEATDAIGLGGVYVETWMTVSGMLAMLSLPLRGAVTARACEVQVGTWKV